MRSYDRRIARTGGIERVRLGVVHPAEMPDDRTSIAVVVSAETLTHDQPRAVAHSRLDRGHRVKRRVVNAGGDDHVHLPDLIRMADVDRRAIGEIELHLAG